MLPLLKIFSKSFNFNHAEQQKIKLEEKIKKEFSVIKGKPLKNMRKLLKYTDKINAYFKLFSPCKKGCSKCCFIDVAVSSMEISMIEKYLAQKRYNVIKRNETIINSILKREKNGEIFGRMCKGEKCIFLRNDKCFIYTVRPYFCRSYLLIEEKDDSKCGYKDNIAKTLDKRITCKAYEKIVMYSSNMGDIIHINQELFEIRDCFHEVNW